MKDIDALLQEHNLDRQEIEELLQQNEKINAIKLVFDKTGLGLKNSKDLVEAIQSKETHFDEDNSLTNSNVSVKTFSKHGQLTVKLKLNNQPEKIVFPSDPDWAEVKKVMGDKPEIIAYEKEYLENPTKFQSQKNTLFIEEEGSGKWKVVLLAAIFTIFIIYLIYSNS
ncbi:hypothetical protein [Epilithonimonas sp. UC225_85]|uniref:hypothetical protein n=1 Tax=Epilithonimonas sp. UC225_85 TaxID=3350167 RepID=UPI0036D43C1E